MNSDHVQRYHVRLDGYIYGVSSGEWVKVRDVKRLLKGLEEYKLWDIDKNSESLENITFYDKEDIEQLFKED